MDNSSVVHATRCETSPCPPIRARQWAIVEMSAAVKSSPAPIERNHRKQSRCLLRVRRSARYNPSKQIRASTTRAKLRIWALGAEAKTPLRNLRSEPELLS